MKSGRPILASLPSFGRSSSSRAKTQTRLGPWSSMCRSRPKTERSPYEVMLPKAKFLQLDSVANVQGIGSLPTVRLGRRIGAFPTDTINEIKKAIAWRSNSTYKQFDTLCDGHRPIASVFDGIAAYLGASVRWVRPFGGSRIPARKRSSMRINISSRTRSDRPPCRSRSARQSGSGSYVSLWNQWRS